MVNFLILSGNVCKVPLLRTSPSGIPHCQFVIEHFSVQEEAKYQRQAWCRIPVIMSGYKNYKITQNIIVGNYITAQGFISWHKSKNGLTKIVLHAKRIKLIEF